MLWTAGQGVYRVLRALLDYGDVLQLTALRSSRVWVAKVLPAVVLHDKLPVGHHNTLALTSDDVRATLPQRCAGECALACSKRTRYDQEADMTVDDAGQALGEMQPSPKRHQLLTDNNGSTALSHPAADVFQGCERRAQQREVETTTLLHMHSHINAAAADTATGGGSLLLSGEAHATKSVHVKGQKHLNDSPQSSEDFVASQLPNNHTSGTPQLNGKMTVGQACELPSLHLKVALRTWAKVRCPAKYKELGDAMLVTDLLPDFDCYVAYLQQAVAHGLKPITARKYAQELRLFLKQHQHALGASTKVDYDQILEQLSTTVAAFRSLEREHKQQLMRAGQTALSQKRSGVVKRTKLAAAAFQYHGNSDPLDTQEHAEGAPAALTWCDGSTLPKQQAADLHQDWQYQYAAGSMSKLSSCAVPRRTDVQHDVFIPLGHCRTLIADPANSLQAAAGMAQPPGTCAPWTGAEQQACVKPVSTQSGDTSFGDHTWFHAGGPQQVPSADRHPQHLRTVPQYGSLHTLAQDEDQDQAAVLYQAAGNTAALASADAAKRPLSMAQQAAANTCTQLPFSDAAAAAVSSSQLPECNDTAAACSLLMDAVAQSLNTSSAYLKLLDKSTTSNGSAEPSTHAALASLKAGHPAQASLQAAVAAAAASAMMGMHTLSIITGTAGHLQDVLSHVARSSSDPNHILAQLPSSCLTQQEHDSSHSCQGASASGSVVAHTPPLMGALYNWKGLMPPVAALDPSAQADVTCNYGSVRRMQTRLAGQQTKQQWIPGDPQELYKLPKQLHQELGNEQYLPESQPSTFGHVHGPRGFTYLQADQQRQQPLQQQWGPQGAQPSQAIPQQQHPQHESGWCLRTVRDTQRSLQAHHQPIQDQTLGKWEQLTASAHALDLCPTDMAKLIQVLSGDTTGCFLSAPAASTHPAVQTSEVAARGTSTTAPSDSAAEVQTPLCEAAVPFAADGSGRCQNINMASSFADVLLSAAAQVGQAEQCAKLQQDAPRSANKGQLGQPAQKPAHQRVGDCTVQDCVARDTYLHAQGTCFSPQQACVARPAVAAFAAASSPIVTPDAALSGCEDAAAAAPAGRHMVRDRLVKEGGCLPGSTDDDLRLQECLQELQQIRHVLSIRSAPKQEQQLLA